MHASSTLGLALFTAAVAAQSGIQLITQVGLATLCLPYTSQPTFQPAPTIINNGNIINVNIVAPSCNVCGCQGTGCTAINIYQTTYQNFNSVGALTQQVYVVTETYPGIAPTAVPTVTVSCPLGFTTTVQTCTVGPTPTSATLTVPVTTCPFVTGLSAPSTVPAGVSVSPYAFCPTIPASAPTVAPVAPVAPAAAPPAAAPPAAAAAPAAGSVSGSSAAGAAPAPAAPAAGSVSGSSAAGAAPAPAAPAAGSNSGSSPAAAAPAPNSVAGSSPASTTYVKSSASRPVASLIVGCALGFVLSLAATL